jgi:hypothetical protein
MPYGHHVARCHACNKEWMVGDCIPSVCKACSLKGHANTAIFLNCPACIEDWNKRDAEIAKAVGRDPEPLKKYKG